MNRPTDHERLFDDALADETPAGFREALLGETLRQARKRRHQRRAWQGLAALAALGLVAMLVRQVGTRPPSALPLVASACDIIHTVPLPVGALVTTKPFSPELTIASGPNAEYIQTAAAKVEYREVNDDELLALAAPRPAVLVRLGPHLAELIFANPPDQSDSPLN